MILTEKISSQSSKDILTEQDLINVVSLPVM